MNKDYFWKNDKVSLRILEEVDADVLYEMMHDTKLRMMAEGGISLPATIDTAEDMAFYAMEMTKTGKELWFAILDHENRMVGYAILGYINERQGNVQCDVTVFPKYRGRGYGRGTFDILLKYAFYERRLYKVNCFVMEDNTIAKEVLPRLGFQKEAMRTAMFYSKGEYKNQFYYGITVEEFENIQKHTEDKTVWESDLGKLSKPYNHIGDLLNERDYFWQYQDICLREMTEEDYHKNKEIVFSSMDARYYDNDVKLPMITGELSEREKEYLHFGGEGDRIEFAVTDLNGRYVGNVNLHSIDRKNGTFSISFYFLKNSREKGYATKAVALLVSYAFYELRLNKLNVCVNEGNEASAKIMRRLGCVVEGIWRKNAFYDGNYRDVVLFGIVKDDFCRKIEQMQ